MKITQLLLFITILLLQLGCSTMKDFEVIKYNNFEVVHINTKPATINSFIIYDLKLKTAAVIDPGWKADSLISFIKRNNLHLAYIFLTHGHIDHLYCVPEIKKQFPDVKICLHKAEFENIPTYLQWLKDHPNVSEINKPGNDLVYGTYLSFDPASMPKPDVFVEDNQSFTLGNLELKTIHLSGHATGEICYYIGNIIFSGDLLLYRTVGTYSFPGGSKEDLIKSVRLLYKIFPDETTVYPGHGEFTDIGSEKLLNKKITTNKEAL